MLPPKSFCAKLRPRATTGISSRNGHIQSSRGSRRKSVSPRKTAPESPNSPCAQPSLGLNSNNLESQMWTSSCKYPTSSAKVDVDLDEGRSASTKFGPGWAKIGLESTMSGLYPGKAEATRNPESKQDTDLKQTLNVASGMICGVASRSSRARPNRPAPAESTQTPNLDWGGATSSEVGSIPTSSARSTSYGEPPEQIPASHEACAGVRPHEVAAHACRWQSARRQQVHVVDRDPPSNLGVPI